MIDRPLCKRMRILFVAAFGSLALTSTAHAQDERQRFPQVETASPHGVDLQTGRFKKEGVDLSIGPLVVDHYLTTMGQGPFAGDRGFPSIATSLQGRSWYYETTGVRNRFLQIGKQKLIFHVRPDGTFFPFDSANTGWKMETVNSNLVVTNKSGMIYTFTRISGSPLEYNLSTTLSPDGHKITNEYGSSGGLKLVKSNRGFAVVLDATSTTITACGYNLTVTEVTINSTCAAASLKTVYGFNASGQLTTITDLNGDVVSLQYSPFLTCVTLPNSSTCAIQNAYDGNNNFAVLPDQVTQQTTAEGEVWNYNHLPIENIPGDYVPGLGEVRESFAWMYPPTGGNTAAVYGNGFVSSVTTPGGNTTYEYSTLAYYYILMGGGVNATWTGPHYYSVFPSKITYPEGNSIGFTRDWADNVTERKEVPKYGSGEPIQTTAWTYPVSYKYSSPTICAVTNTLCDKPTKIIDPNGNITDYTYDPTHGGVLTETGPAVGGIRPQKRYTYTQRYAKIKNGSGTVAMTPPIYLLTKEEYCKTTAASGSGCAGGTADEVVTTYDYGNLSIRNNLLLRGTVVDDGGLSLRTCYLYDEYGRKIAETQPEGTGATCP